MPLLDRLPDDSMSAFGRNCRLELYCVAVKVGPMQLHNILPVTVTQCVTTIVQADRVFLFNIESNVGLLLHMEHYVLTCHMSSEWVLLAAICKRLCVCESIAKSRAFRLPRVAGRDRACRKPCSACVSTTHARL